jgi:hypothetical protein
VSPDGEAPGELGSAGRDTFVVRIWSSDGGGGMRGHIHHVRSRKRAYFASRERLLSFIQAHSRTSEHDSCPS